MASKNYSNWRNGECHTGDATYHTFNPPARPNGKVDALRDTILLDSGFIARPVYQTECPTCENWHYMRKFLGYQLVEHETGHYWKEPKTLAEIKQHHAKVMEAIRAGRGIARVAALCLEPAENQQAA